MKMKTKLRSKLEEIVGAPLRRRLERRHRKEYFSFKAIAREINEKYKKDGIKTNKYAISKLFGELEIEKLSMSELMLKGKKLPSKEELNQLYNIEYKSIRKIAKKYEVDYSTIYDLFDVYGMQRRDSYESRLRGRKKPSDEELYVLRVIEGKNFTDIAKISGFNGATIGRWFKKIKGIQLKAEYYQPWLKKYGVLNKINKK